MKIDQNTNQKELDFPKNHSHNFLEMAYRTDKIERIERPDGYGKRTGVCGDTIEMFLMFKNDKIETASFCAQGCVNTVACSNTVVTMAEGKTIEEAWNITAEKVTDFLETLPSKETHCAELAVGAFYLALSGLSDIKNSSWKKLYKK